eukprot:3613215-Prymnesium_polylepis.1
MKAGARVRIGGSQHAVAVGNWARGRRGSHLEQVAQRGPILGDQEESQHAEGGDGREEVGEGIDRALVLARVADDDERVHHAEEHEHAVDD